ncbi:MAG TPA: hypothetical protein VFQ77_03060 [Pseudonocardiaceae bacterium]|nr:hypothetical protein [Pseudonocardiaceae bacterium]
MTRLSPLQRARITTGLEIVPPSLLIVMKHPWLGAGTLGVVLAVAALDSWLVARSARESQQAILTYAQVVASMGGDPSNVVAALSRSPDEDDSSPTRSPRGHAAGIPGGRGPDPKRPGPPGLPGG